MLYTAANDATGFPGECDAESRDVGLSYRLVDRCTVDRRSRPMALNGKSDARQALEAASPRSRGSCSAPLLPSPASPRFRWQLRSSANQARWAYPASALAVSTGIIDFAMRVISSSVISLSGGASGPVRPFWNWITASPCCHQSRIRSASWKTYPDRPFPRSIGRALRATAGGRLSESRCNGQDSEISMPCV